MFPAMSWVAGHVFMSIGAPLAVLDTLVPRHRGRPLLGPVGITVTAVLCILAALLIRDDTVRLHGQLGPAETLTVLATVITLVALALTRVGRPVKPGDRQPIPGWRLALIGAVGMFSIDILPATWRG